MAEVLRDGAAGAGAERAQPGGARGGQYFANCAKCANVSAIFAPNLGSFFLLLLPRGRRCSRRAAAGRAQMLATSSSTTGGIPKVEQTSPLRRGSVGVGFLDSAKIRKKFLSKS